MNHCNVCLVPEKNSLQRSVLCNRVRLKQLAGYIFYFFSQLSAKTTPSAPVEDASPVSKYSRQLSVAFKYPNGTDRRIYNLTTPIELGIKQDPNQPRFNRSLLGLANPKIVPTREDEYLFYHQVVVINSRSAIQLKFR